MKNPKNSIPMPIMPMPVRLIYIILFEAAATPMPLRYFVLPHLVSLLPSGDYGRPQPIMDEHLLLQNEALHLENIDREIWQIFHQLKSMPGNDSAPHFALADKQGNILLRYLLQTQRCYFASHRSKPLHAGTTRQGRVEWIPEANGKQRLRCWISGGAHTILPLQPLWYIDHQTYECGLLDLPMNPGIVSALLFAPPLSHDEMQHIHQLLKNAATEQKAQEEIRDYLHELSGPITEKQVDNWYCEWQPAANQGATTVTAVPARNLHHWFEFEMGISLEGKKYNLLPALAELIQSQLAMHSIHELNKLPDDKVFSVRLPNNKFFSVPMQKLRKILTVLTELYQEDSLTGGEKLRLSRIRALQLNKLGELLEIKNFKWYGDLSPQILAEKFALLAEHKAIRLPKSFHGQLRAYQQDGLRWLQFLRDVGLGGILADDMGLGKTVQILSHLLIETTTRTKNLRKKPSLIIAPTSLVMNWIHEAKRFTPKLKILLLHGSARKELYHQISHHDIIITSYALLIRDAEILLPIEYNIVILDEAQYIKNVQSKAGQLVRRVQAEQRLCLTGTPMENHLGELWSLFHFLLPGLLGERRQFQQLFRIPIEKNQDAARREQLRERIAPFFLRRTKKEVLPELPDKIEMQRSVILTDAQRELYESVRIALHEKVMLTIKERGLAQSQLFILEALLKLRQICCDPRLLKLSAEPAEHYTEETSAKLQMLMELLPHLVEQGRRILLFSQFTQMLALIEKACQKIKLNYVKLTGQTKDRDAVIQQFQQSDTLPLFLISLKAGGVGLNLTKADTVIHYDPWWNPAVENQATDRAHRIGQEKTVFVYKLITSGTIEEKMLVLQEEKKALLNSILSDQHDPLTHFAPADIEKLFAPLGDDEPL